MFRYVTNQGRQLSRTDVTLRD